MPHPRALGATNRYAQTTMKTPEHDSLQGRTGRAPSPAAPQRPRAAVPRAARLLAALGAALPSATAAARCALVIAGLLAAAAPRPAAQELDNDTCLACHGIEGFAGADEKPLFVAPQEFAASSHAAFPCTSCHADVTALPHEGRVKRVDVDACSTCHSDTVAAYQGSIHGSQHTNGNDDTATCTDCHGPAHSIRASTNPVSPVYPLNLPRTCAACHDNQELIERYNIPVADAYQLYLDSIHGRALTRSGLLVAANCSSCHGSHDIRVTQDRQSMVFRANIPATCGACHAGILAAYSEGTHSDAVTSGNLRAPVCISCHTAHEIERVDTRSGKLQVVHECGTCHEESLKTYRDTFHGQVTALGYTRVARCSDCHGSHKVLPASDPQSSIAPSNLVATCQKCHPRANANFVQFSPHADHEDADKFPLLYYTAHMMDLLIIGVFAFFGVHTFLWFLRSLVHQNGKRRQPPWHLEE